MPLWTEVIRQSADGGGKGEGEGLGYYVGNGYLPGLVVGRFELYFDFNLKHTNRSFCRCLMPDEQLRRRRRLRRCDCAQWSKAYVLVPPPTSRCNMACRGPPFPSLHSLFSARLLCCLPGAGAALALNDIFMMLTRVAQHEPSTTNRRQQQREEQQQEEEQQQRRRDDGEDDADADCSRACFACINSSR